MAKITIDGSEFIVLDKRVKVKIGTSWQSGALHELVCNSVLPQYFALMDESGKMRDLGNDVYALELSE